MELLFRAIADSVSVSDLDFDSLSHPNQIVRGRKITEDIFVCP